MGQIDRNTVSAKNQLKENEFFSYINPEGKGIRVLIIGNSITRHGIAPGIGWNNDWGMAASSADKDYVHLLSTKICNKEPDASFLICHAVLWERNYKNGKGVHAKFEPAHMFAADVIIMRCIENCPQHEFDFDAFNSEYIALIDYLNPGNKAEVILTTGFWKHIGDSEIRKIASQRNYPLVDLGYLGEDDNMKAIGRFEHSGVAAHPGDKGMKFIADDIYDCYIKCMY